jgi:hypothetical protein
MKQCVGCQVVIGADGKIFWISPHAYPATVPDVMQLKAFVSDEQVMTNLEDLHSSLRSSDKSTITTNYDFILGDMGYSSTEMQRFNIITPEVKPKGRELIPSSLIKNEVKSNNFLIIY